MLDTQAAGGTVVGVIPTSRVADPALLHTLTIASPAMLQQLRMHVARRATFVLVCETRRRRGPWCSYSRVDDKYATVAMELVLP